MKFYISFIYLNASGSSESLQVSPYFYGNLVEIKDVRELNDEIIKIVKMGLDESKAVTGKVYFPASHTIVKLD